MDTLSIGACVRTYDNNPKAVGLMSQLFKSLMTWVYLRIKFTDDELQGRVRKLLVLNGTVDCYWDRLIIDERDWSWTEGLNDGAVELVAQGAEFMLCCSTEVEPTRGHVEAMAQVLLENPNVVMVGTSFDTYVIVNGERVSVELGPLYNKSPRNTFSLVRLSAFFGEGSVGLFDPFCDLKEVGGMEDVDWSRRAMEMGYEVKMLDLKVPVQVGVGEHWNVQAKQARELGALGKILEHRRQVLSGDPDALQRFEQVLRAQWYGSMLDLI